MTRARPAAEDDVHERFTAWLLHGTDDEPARDLALHGAFCPECRAHMAALDLLPLVDTGRAPLPPSRRGAAPVIGASFGPRLAWAAASLLIIAIGGAAVLSGRLPTGPGSPSPAQQVLGGFGGGELSSAAPLASDSPGESAEGGASAAADASDSTPEPTTAVSVPPAASPVGPSAGTAAPTTAETRRPSRSPRPTAAATGTPSPATTLAPTPTPEPECSDGIDNDGDGGVDWGLDPLVNDLECLGPGDDSEVLP